MLHLAAVAEDEPPALDKAGLDRRALNRKAVKHFDLLRHVLTDQYGRSAIRALGPGYRANPDGRVDIRDALPRLITLSGPGHDEADGGPGAWISRGNGKSGKSIIDLVQNLGACDEKTAIDWLRDWTDRIVEIVK